MKVILALFVLLAPVFAEGQTPDTIDIQPTPTCVNCDTPDVAPKPVELFVNAKDGQKLPVLAPFPVDMLQRWHDQAAANFAGCYEHYKACWWNRFFEQRACGLQ